MKPWASALLGILFFAVIIVVCWYSWWYWPYPPTIVAIAASLTYVALAWIPWPLEAWTFLVNLQSHSEQLRTESIPLLRALCSTLGTLDGCRYRHVHWGELIEEEHACALMNIRACHMVTERLLGTIRAGWYAGLIVSIFITVGTVLVYVNGVQNHTWPGVYKETIITAGAAFALQIGLYIILFVLRGQNKQVDRVSTEAIDRKHTVMVDPTTTLTFFKTMTPTLLQWVKDYKSNQTNPDYPVVIQMLDQLKMNADIMRTSISQEFSPLKYFDYHSHEQTLSFSAWYVEAWERHIQKRHMNEPEKLTVYYLFLLHEFFHLSQNISSYRYHFTDHALRPLLAADYRADALSVLALYELYTQYHPPGWGSYGQWSDELAALIRLAIIGIEVFTAYQHEYPLNSINWFSFHRYLQWHFQYARARQFQAGGQSIKMLDLLMPPEFALGGIENQSVRYQRGMAFLKPQLVVIGWNAKLYEFTSDENEFVDLLLDAILQGELERSNRLFGDFFHRYPEFIGR